MRIVESNRSVRVGPVARRPARRSLRSTIGPRRLVPSPERSAGERAVTGILPTVGDPSGRHRALEPRGAFPLLARRLDPQPDVWDSEARIALSHLALGPAALDALVDRFGADAGRLRAAVLDAVTDRGGLPPMLAGARLVGTVAAVGPAHPGGLAVGELLVTTGPVTAVPAWLADLSAWDGRRTVTPVVGHAIVAATAPVAVVPPGLALATALAVATACGLSASLTAAGVQGERVAVLGTNPATVALVAAAAGQAGAAAVTHAVAGLSGARDARAALTSIPVIVDQTAPTEVADAVRDTLGAPADCCISCDGDDVSRDRGAALARAAVLATHDDGTVLLGHAADTMAATSLDATLGGRRRVMVARSAAPDRGFELTRLLRSHTQLRHLLDQQAAQDHTRTPPEDR